MAYATAGLRRISEGVINIWVLDTVDAVASATGAGYVTDAGPTAVLPGKGMNIGDLVFIRVVGALPGSGSSPASVTDTAWAHVSAVNASTGAGTLVLSHTNA